MKKGFTMIEILAVFTITAVILLITVPLITGTLKKSSEGEYNTFKETIFLAAEAYINDGAVEVTKDNTEETPAVITISELVSSGFLKSTLKNPKTKQTVLESEECETIVKVWRDDENVLNYEIEEPAECEQ